MNGRNNCIVWIHGIGETGQGYSKPWTEALEYYFENSGQTQSYTEVLWSDIFGEDHPALSLVETLIETAIHRILQVDPTAVDFDLDAYVNEVVLYLVRPDIHAAVNQKLKAALSNLSNCDTISIIAHSMGTVIAYETLQELAGNRPGFRLTNFFTLGSPLKHLKLFLGNRPGPRPANTATWVNIYAQGDLIGSALSPDFEVNSDRAVPSIAGVDPHGSYFDKTNKLVLGDIIANTIRNS